MAMRVDEILAMIPNSILEEIGKDLKVDSAYQKLTGLKMFKILLYSLAETTRISLRTMESVYNHLFTNIDTTRHSSLSDRLVKIKPDYFKKILDDFLIVQQYHLFLSPYFLQFAWYNVNLYVP